MRDDLCVDFLQWCLPRLDMRWAGFRKVRGQVCKRITRRMHDLNLNSTDDYRAYLEAHPKEWCTLDELCRITISRFYRDRDVFDALRFELLPELAKRTYQRSDQMLHAWSAGCASGEEAYTLRLIWELELRDSYPQIDLRVIASDADKHILERARHARYSAGTLKDLPDDWIEMAFERLDGEEPYRLRPKFRKGVEFQQQDIREETPEKSFDLICCRNLVFMYFDEPLQRSCLNRMSERLRSNGLLILGKHEELPSDVASFGTLDRHKRIYRKR